MPWVNVIANPRFGTIVTSSGATHTWAGNSRENRLTPFANDAISDPTGEAFFVRDDDTGETWTPTPGPLAARGDRPMRRAAHRRADPLFARHPRHHPRARRVRRRRRPGQVLAAHADQRRKHGAKAERLRLQRVGARAAARRRAGPRRHGDGSGHRRHPRAKRLHPGLRPPRGVRVRKRAPARLHRRSRVVHRQERRPVGASGIGADDARRPDRRVAGSLRGAADRVRPASGRVPAAALPDWPGHRPGRCDPADRQARPRRSCDRGIGPGAGVVG